MKKKDPARWNGYKEEEIPKTCETCEDWAICEWYKDCPEDLSGCKSWMIALHIFMDLEK